MKSHKYWSIGALITMLGTFIQVIRDQKKGHKYFAASSLLLHDYGYLYRTQDDFW